MLNNLFHVVEQVDPSDQTIVDCFQGLFSQIVHHYVKIVIVVVYLDECFEEDKQFRVVGFLVMAAHIHHFLQILFQ